MAERHRRRVAVNGRSQGSERGGSGGMFVASPPVVRAPAVASATPLHKTRVLKRGAAAESTPQYSSNQIDGASIDSYVQEKLAFDELLRVQRSRAEDVGRLIVELGVALKTEGEGVGKDREKGCKAAMFREEWRVGREDEVLGRLRAEEARENSLSEADRDAKIDVVRSHVRRSIHLFLTAESATPQKTNKLSNDLLYAQQMDRLLREMDQSHPFTVVRHAIADARAKFQQLLNCLGQTADTATVLKLHADSSETEDHPADARSRGVADVLHLYENVVDARTMTQAPKMVRAMSDTQAKQHPTAAILEPSAAFLGSLERQRDEAERQAAEALAEKHRRRVCVRRIQMSYWRHRQRRRRKERAEALRQRVERRAATVIQTTFLYRIRAFRALQDARAATKRKHQARRVALCCFWRRIYPTRCGFATFKLALVITDGVIGAVVRIQSVWRRWKAQREASFRRAFRAIRRKRQRQHQWEQRKAQAMTTAPLSLRLAEWLCHVAIEKRRVEREQRREHTRFAAEWSRYESRLEKDVMRSRLPSEWIPQLDPVSGETFYLNVQTTKSSREHPNMVLCRQLLKKQKQRAEQLYEERLQRLEQYVARLETDSEDMTAMLLEKIHVALK